MLGNDAYLGSLSLRSVVTTHGILTFMVSRPPSTSLVTLSVSSVFFSTLDAKVAEDILVMWLVFDQFDYNHRRLLAFLK